MSDFLSVRDRMSGTTNNSNERIGRGENTSFLGLRSKDGLASITNQVTNGRSFRWKAHCDSCGCDWTYDHAYLVNGGEVRCPASSHGTTGDARRTAGLAEQQLRKEVIMSPRARAEQAARAEEQAAFEKEQDGGVQ
jgi:hypothetical protein